MQEEAPEAIRTTAHGAAGVDRVAGHSVADGGEVDADLVGAPGFDLDAEMGCIFECFYGDFRPLHYQK